MPKALVALSGVQNIDAVLSGVKWSGAVVTFGFPTLASEYGSYARLIDQDNNPATPAITVNETTGFLALNAMQQSAARAAFAEVGSLTTISVLEQQPGGGADVRLAMSTTRNPTNTTAYAAYPTDDERGGDAWFNNADYNTPRLGTYGYQTFFHEIGHALGLKHGHEADSGNSIVMTSDRDSLEFSTMTYRAYVGHPAGGYGVTDGNFPQSYMMYDIVALQHMYGGDFTTRAENTMYRFDPATGQMFIDGIGQGIPQNGAGTDVNVLFRTIWDGNGVDTYDFSAYDSGRQLAIDLAPGGWTDVDSDSNFQAADLKASDPGTKLARGQVFNALLYSNDTRSLIENAIGGFGDDSIKGNAAVNSLHGGPGNDFLYGLLGADVLDGGTGNDWMDGGADADRMTGGRDDDTYVVIDLLDVVVETAGQGTDTVVTSLNQYTLPHDIENLRLFGAAFIGTGNELPNKITGSALSNILTGGLGLDRLEGGAGDDAYALDDVTPAGFLLSYDTVVEAAGAGTDTVFVGSHSGTVDYLLTANVENGTVTGTAAFNLVGNQLGNRLTGNGAVNVLSGMGGNDVLEGAAGRDTLRGGLGNDSYLLTDVVLVGVLPDYDTVVEAAGEGTDTAFVGSLSGIIDYQLAANIENGVVTGTSAFALYGNELNNAMTGNAAVNTLYGLSGNDVLDGRNGLDTLRGGVGDDTYLLNDVVLIGIFPHYDAVVEAAGEGTDTIRVGSQSGIIDYLLDANVENGVVSGAAAFTLRGNELNNALTGNAAVNSLFGAVGNDILNGGTGADVMSGGAGNDTYYIDNTADAVVELAGGGSDTVVAALSYALAAGVEVELLRTAGSSSTTAINLTGNAFAQTLQGNAAANTLNGAGGADTMYGFSGNDIYVVDNADDRVEEVAGKGTDTVIASKSYLLQAGSSVEVLRTTGSASTYAVALTGNELANTILGNAAANVINGRAGSDLLTGFGGSDTFRFNTAPGASNIDRITDFNVAQDVIQLENAIFTAVGTAVGALAAGKFYVGSAAHDLDDRVIYNNATGALIYDSNGSGIGGSVQFARLTAGLAMTSADFFVI